MTAHPIFRQATIDDIPAMSHIRMAVTENVLRDPSRVTPQMYEDFLDKSGRGWVAEKQGEVVAFCYADKANASIWALFVRPGEEGQGLATTLLQLAVDWLFELGHDCVHLSTTPNTRADRFYAAQGWLRTPGDDTEVHFTLSKAPAISG